MILPYLNYVNQKNIILASGSPRRGAILSQLGILFKTVPSTFPEDLDPTSFAKPEDYVLENAWRKGQNVAEQLKAKNWDLIISADTIVVSDGKILEKPQSVTHAYDILKSLSGREHHILTAVTLLSATREPLATNTPDSLNNSPLQTSSWKRVAHFCERTYVTMSDLSEDVIHSYIASGEPMDKAGAYAIQGIGATLIEKVNGCYFNVVGFPVFRFCYHLSQLIKEKKI